MFLLARRQFKEGGRENRHAPFDAGSAWMSLSLQARRLGLYAHAMAGFSMKKAYEVLGVSEKDYLIMAAVAVGRQLEARPAESSGGRREGEEHRTASGLSASGRRSGEPDAAHVVFLRQAGFDLFPGLAAIIAEGGPATAGVDSLGSPVPARIVVDGAVG